MATTMIRTIFASIAIPKMQRFLATITLTTQTKLQQQTNKRN
jgi:hypothetical protein